MAVHTENVTGNCRGSRRHISRTVQSYWTSVDTGGHVLDMSLLQDTSIAMQAQLFSGFDDENQKNARREPLIKILGLFCKGLHVVKVTFKNISES